MSKISPVLLDDTYQLMQLARETALAQGKQNQANRLSPVIDDLRTLVNTPKPAAAASASKPAAASSAQAASSGISPLSGVMAQSDFRTLLEATKKGSTAAQTQTATQNVSSVLERNQMVVAMSSANMSDIDVARQLGMSRDEVRLILNLNQSTKSTREVSG
jgi:hypothetical protein